MGIQGSVLNWMKSYRCDRSQRVVINGQMSDWSETNAGVPQGSILGPLLFLVFINDIVIDLETDPFLFADDTSLFHSFKNREIAFQTFNRDLDRLSTWADQWRVEFNASKTVFMTISMKQIRGSFPNLFMNNIQLTPVPCHTHLGLTLTENLTWDKHVDRICSNALKSVNILKRLCLKIPRETKLKIYKTFIRPKLEYANVIFDACSEVKSRQLENAQRQAALVCSHAYRHTSHTSLLQDLGLDLLSTRRKCHKLNIFF